MFSKKDSFVRPLFKISTTLLIFIALQNPAFATIGQTSDTVETDRAQFEGATSSTVTIESAFTVYSFSANGNTIKEFVDNNTNTVFAVTWRGLSHPDLSKLLGTHYVAYSAKLAQQPKAAVRKATSITTSKLKVQRGGHMRDWHGSAVMTSLLPAGVTESDLK